jgi:NADH:ubiquinone oxidoreductase subunit K
MTQAAVAVVALVMLLMAALGIARRRSLIGQLVGVHLGAGSLILFATGLFDFAGLDSSTGQMFVAGLIALAVAASVLLIALHLAAARAGRRTSDLEPW